MNLGGVIHLNKSGICILCGAVLVLFIYMVTNNTSVDSQSMQKINLKRLLKVAIKAATNGGKEVVAAKDNLNVKIKGLTKEGMQDRVTTADYLSHCSIVGTLKHAYPSLNIISEEAKAECNADQEIDYAEITDFVPEDINDHWEDLKDVTVWIDPLDATQEYTEKLYDYVTTMVCVAIKGKPVIGIIHRPFIKDTETYWAWVDTTKSSNLQPVKRESDKLRIIISRSHSGKIQKVLSQNIKDFDMRNLVIAAGAGYKSLKVATGEVDAYLHITAIKKWDICAGNAIINALGGQMTTKFGKLIDYKDATDVQNEKGLVATLNNHDMFISKL